MLLKLSDFDYVLPKELIAQYPIKERNTCRLMAIDRKRRLISHENFKNIVKYFKRGDCLVLNNTKVIPARLFGRRKTGGKVELFLLEKKNPVCEALVRPSRKLKEGEKIVLESGKEAEILGQGDIGRFVRFNCSVDDILKEAGHVPLPPYINRIDEESDRCDYQTVYGVKEGATASPTAGLHFTKEVLETAVSEGVELAYVTLHVSYGTFAPVKTENITDHRMHSESFEFTEEAAAKVNEAKANGGRLIAVGTTSCRVLETCAVSVGKVEAKKGKTDLFIYPPYEFKIVDALLTNFHFPKSTLLMLVSAFAGRELIFKAYKEAIARKYRFFSYGDAMLIL